MPRRPFTKDSVLVALDLAVITGWAVGPIGRSMPTSIGSWPLPPTDPLSRIGAQCGVLENTIITAFDAWDPAAVVVAEPFVARNLAECRKKFGLLGILEVECWRRDIPLMEQPEPTVRKEILGRGMGPTELMKSLVHRWCAGNGINVRDHNEGDAAVFWTWTRGELLHRVAA